MISTQKRETLIKLMALADSGPGPEAQSAANMLDRLLAKYGMSRSDLQAQAEPTEMVSFAYRTKLESLLPFYVCSYICQQRFEHYYQVKRNTVALDIPRPYAESCRSAYKTYLKAFREFVKKEQRMLMMAFVSKHNLFLPEKEGGDEAPSGRAYSAEETALILNMASRLDDVVLTDESHMIAPSGIGMCEDEVIG